MTSFASQGDVQRECPHLYLNRVALPLPVPWRLNLTFRAHACSLAHKGCRFFVFCTRGLLKCHPDLTGCIVCNEEDRAV